MTSSDNDQTAKDLSSVKLDTQEPIETTKKPEKEEDLELNEEVKDDQVDQAHSKVYNELADTLNNVNVRLADRQADPNSPLYSVASFEELGLDERLLKGIYAMKFVKPSKVQERALPLLLADPPQNMIAQSQSGTGKTAAFVLTMLSRVDPSRNETQAVCLAPARELARQIMTVVTQMGQFTDCTTAYALPENRGSRNRQPITANVVVGTPGTMLDLEKRGLLSLRKVKIFVLDEADVMLDKQGMGMQSIRLKRLCPSSTQILLFSATYDESVRDFANQIVSNANEITLKREELSLEGIKQFYIDCRSLQHKLDLLSDIYGILTISQSIIFVETRARAEEVQAFMQKEGHMTSLLHGGMEPTGRDQIIDEFRSGKTKVLITTNVLARGIDILQVSLVINYDLPITVDGRPDADTYLHRIGRTGRFGRSGISINFVHDRKSMDCMLDIQRMLGRDIVRIPTGSLEEMEETLVRATRP